jgi:hypothetical protein
MPAALKEGQIFVKKKHELADLMKQLDRITPDAIEELGNALTNDKLPLKDRLRIAEVVIDMKIRVADQISKDELTRQIAEIKATGLKTPLVDNDTPKPSGPRLELGTIQSV